MLQANSDFGQQAKARWTDPNPPCLAAPPSGSIYRMRGNMYVLGNNPRVCAGDCRLDCPAKGTSVLCPSGLPQATPSSGSACQAPPPPMFLTVGPSFLQPRNKSRQEAKTAINFRPRANLPVLRCSFVIRD